MTSPKIYGPRSDIYFWKFLIILSLIIELSVREKLTLDILKSDSLLGSRMGLISKGNILPYRSLVRFGYNKRYRHRSSICTCIERAKR